MQREDKLEESVKEEVIHQLEKEYETSRRQLQDLEFSSESKKRREIQTLRRLGLLDHVSIRYSLPDIDIHYDFASDPSDELTSNAVSDDEEELEDTEEEAGHVRHKKPAWKKLGWLVETSFFRPRSRSETASRKYRAMSAGVVANPTSTSVKSLRRLYTGRSEFFDVDDEPIQSSAPAAAGPSVTNELTSGIAEKKPIDPKVLYEIDRFESLIQNYFKKKNDQSRH